MFLFQTEICIFVALIPKSFGTLTSMENKTTSSQLPTALRLGNSVTTDKSTIIENFNNFSTAGHAFHLAAPPDVLKELQNLDPYKSTGLVDLDPL